MKSAVNVVVFVGNIAYSSRTVRVPLEFDVPNVN